MIIFLEDVEKNKGLFFNETPVQYTPIVRGVESITFS